MVDLTLRVLYRPGTDLPQLYRTLGTNYAQRLLPSVGVALYPELQEAEQTDPPDRIIN